MKPFDTDRTPWLFTPHDDGELDEFFSSDHSRPLFSRFLATSFTHTTTTSLSCTPVRDLKIW